MRITQRVKKLLATYESDNAGTKTNLARILMEGRLSGSGSVFLLCLDQGFNGGPAASFAQNPKAYDPHYHFGLAVDSGMSAFVAPLGALESGADTFAGAIPLILEMNSARTGTPHYTHSSAGSVTASIKDALRLGCTGIGCTISSNADQSYDEIRALSEEAKANGLAVIVWSHPLGGNYSIEGETALDTIAHGAHMAALLGAHIICVKVPTAHLEHVETKRLYSKHGITIDTVSDRVRHVRQACFNGRRMILFSVGDSEDQEAVLEDVRGIRDGAVHGCVIGRTSFQSPYDASINMLDQIVKVYQGKV